MRIAINGFGRIGRALTRVLIERCSDPNSGIDLVAVNDLTDAATLAHLLEHDTNYGKLPQPVTVSGAEISVDRFTFPVLSEKDPASLPWGDLGVDVVIEATGRFTAAEDAKMHLQAGAGRVIVSAPSAGADLTVAMGVNDDRFNPESHRILSVASCTTNALAPLANILHEVAGITQGMMSTVHAVTQDQNLLDSPHRDLRRARTAGSNIIPTSTGAAKAIGLVLPELDGKLTGGAIRVPVPVGSIVELTAIVERATTADELHAAYASAAEGRLAGIMRVSDAPLVSSDIVGDRHSCIVDMPLTAIEGNLVKVAAWYDNEWAFSHRLADALTLLR